MNCNEVKILLHDYVDELLDEETENLVQKHVNKCDKCREFYFKLRVFFDLLKDIPFTVEPPKDIIDNLSNSLLEKSIKETTLKLEKSISKESKIRKEQIKQDRILKTARGSIRKSIVSQSLASTIGRESVIGISDKLKMILLLLILLSFGIGYVFYNISLNNSPWNIKIENGECLIDGNKNLVKLWHKGTSLVTKDDSKVIVYVPNSCNMEVYSNSKLILLKAKKNNNVVQLDFGKIKVYSTSLIPYFFVNVNNTTIEFWGGSFITEADENSNTRIIVESGIIELENNSGNCLVDEGYMCELKKNYRIGTPYRINAPDSLKEEIEKFDYKNGGDDSIERIIKYSKAEDALTLLYLIPHVSINQRGNLFQKIANYFPPPSNVTYEGIIKLNKDMLKSWWLEIEWQL